MKKMLLEVAVKLLAQLHDRLVDRLDEIDPPKPIWKGMTQTVLNEYFRAAEKELSIRWPDINCKCDFCTSRMKEAN